MFMLLAPSICFHFSLYNFCYYLSKMGKVRKLRKKYRALCVVNNRSAEGNNQRIDTEDNNPSLDDIIINSKKDLNRSFDLKSTCSISKSIKSCLSGQSISKKDKQRLRHALFLEKLQASAKISNEKKKQRKQKKIDLRDDLPMLLTNIKDKKEKRKNFAFKNLDLPIQKSSSRKGSTKRRNIQMIKDVNLLQKLIKDETLTENPHSQIQLRTLEKLSQECLEMSS